MNPAIRVFVVDGNRVGAGRMTERQFSDGDLIFRAGAPADGVFRIRSGVVQLRAPNGVVAFVETCSDGDVFGGGGFLTGDTRDTNAIAVGPVSVDFLRRNEFLAILTLQPHLLSPIWGPVFDLAARSAAAPEASPASAEPADPAGAGANGDLGIRLIVDDKRLRSVLGVDEIDIRELPFRIGRTASGEGKDTYTDIHLTIEDSRPFNLSRRHFAIEEEDGALIVRDFGSYHGTTVNGLTLGGEERPRTAPLMTGESELVAGKPDSPFRFRILVA